MSKGKTHKSNPQVSNKIQQNPITTAPTTAFTLPKWLPLTLILVATAVLRCQFLDIPLERDESLYSYLGKLALNGGKPYFDFYEMKPPIMFYSYALLVGIFGYSAFGIHLAATAVSLANIYFIFRITQKIGPTAAAHLAAITYAIWSLAGGVSGTHLLSENIQILWALPAILIAINPLKTLTIKQLLAIGFLLSMSFMVKQTSGVLALVLGFYWLSSWFSERKTTPFWAYFKPILWTIAGFILPIIVAIIGLWAIGSGQDAAFWLLEYPRLYSSELSSDEAKMAFGLMQKLVLTDYKGYFIAALLGILAVFFSKKTLSEKVLLISWAVLTTLTVGLGRRFYGHYWLLALPILSILGSLFFQEMSIRLRQKMGNIEAKTVLFIGFLWSIHAIFTLNDYYINPNLTDISRKFSPGNPYVEHQVLSNYLQNTLKPTDRLAVFGSDPQYFIYLNKISQIRHVFAPFISNGQFPNALIWQDETIESFKKTAPEYVILNKYAFAWMYKPNADQHLYDEIYNELRRYYELVAYIENPAESYGVVIKKPENSNRMPTTPSYIAVLKRRVL
jgi:Dolichyl-phosphate-mannose-protein mannosyltransferase